MDTNHFDPDVIDVTLEKFRYVKLNLTDGKTNYGYQVKEFAIIGKEPIQYPEIADQSANVASVEKNLALNKPIYVSSTYAKEGKDPTVLTDGKKDKYWSSDWDKNRTSEYIIIDLGEGGVNALSIESVLVNYKSSNSFCGDYTIEFSKTFDEANPENGFYEVARTKASSWEVLQKYADPNGYVETPITDVESNTIRYVKINMNGHKDWGFQVYEVAVIAKEYTLSIDGNKINVTAGSEYALGDATYGYYNAAKHEAYAPKSQIEVNEDMTLTSINDLIVSATGEAGIRLDENSGIRFKATVSSESNEVAVLDQEVVKEGIRITSSDNITDGILIDKNKVADLLNSGWFQNIKGTYCGSIINVDEKNYVRAYAVQAYTYVVYSNGTKSVEVISNGGKYTEASSIKSIANYIIVNGYLSGINEQYHDLIKKFAEAQ